LRHRSKVAFDEKNLTRINKIKIMQIMVYTNIDVSNENNKMSSNNLKNKELNFTPRLETQSHNIEINL